MLDLRILRRFDRLSPDPLGRRNLLLLFGGRALRSLAQGYLVVIVPLYLADLGFNASRIGIVFSASALVGALLTAAVGFLSDRFGRRALLILISLLMAAGGLVFSISGNFIVLLVAGAVGTFGRGGGAGSGGAWGPYYPAEQPLIAGSTSDKERTTVFGFLSFVGVVAGALGSLLTLVPQALTHYAGLSMLEGYRLLFLLTAVIGCAMAIVVVPVRERRTSKDESPGGKRARDISPLSLPRRTWGLIGRFMATNAVNGLAVGMLGSFAAYWFHRRYGVGSGEIGSLFFAINLAAATPYVFAGRLARRLGAVRTVIATRTCSVFLLAATALMPSFGLAAAFYLLRMIANTLSIPVRQSYLMGVIPPEQRASAAGMSNLPSQVTSSISPTLAGYVIDNVSLDLPLEFAAALQAIYTILYYLFFRNLRPPEELPPHPRNSG